MKTKSKKTRIILSALLCAAFIAVSIGIFAVVAAADDNDNDSGNNDQAINEEEDQEEKAWPHPREFRFKDGELPELPEGFEFPEDFKLPERIENSIADFDMDAHLAECKEKLLQNLKDKLDEKVAAGKMTQEKADELYALLEEIAEEFSVDFLFRDEFKMPGRGGFDKRKDFRDFSEDDLGTETTSDYKVNPTSASKSM